MTALSASPAQGGRGRGDRFLQPIAPVAPTRPRGLSSPDAGEHVDAEALIEAMVLAICATHPDLIAPVGSRLERLEPQGQRPRRAGPRPAVGNTQSQAGQRAHESVLADPM